MQVFWFVGLRCRNLAPATASLWRKIKLGKPLQKPEITGAYPIFAQLVRDITGNVTRGSAAIHGGVSHDTIARMWAGERVSESMILRFALGYKINPNPLLNAAGFDPFPALVFGQSDSATAPPPEPVPAPAPDLWKEHIPPGLRHLPDHILKQSHAIAQAAADKVRDEADLAARQAYNTQFRVIAEILCEAASGNNLPENVITDPASRPYFPPGERSTAHMTRRPAPEYLAELMDPARGKKAGGAREKQSQHGTETPGADIKKDKEAA